MVFHGGPVHQRIALFPRLLNPEKGQSHETKKRAIPETPVPQLPYPVTLPTWTIALRQYRRNAGWTDAQLTVEKGTVIVSAARIDKT